MQVPTCSEIRSALSVAESDTHETLPRIPYPPTDGDRVADESVAGYALCVQHHSDWRATATLGRPAGE